MAAIQSSGARVDSYEFGRWSASRCLGLGRRRRAGFDSAMRGAGRCRAVGRHQVTAPRLVKVNVELARILGSSRGAGEASDEVVPWQAIAWPEGRASMAEMSQAAGQNISTTSSRRADLLGEVVELWTALTLRHSIGGQEANAIALSVRPYAKSNVRVR